MSGTYQSDWIHGKTPPAAAQGKIDTLQVYLLGGLDFETYLSFQRRLHYEITGDRRRAALVLCEHPPSISVGRHGSRSQIRLEADELRRRCWPVRWVNRGGACVLHLPGQLAVYPIIPLDRLGCGVADYLHRLAATVSNVLADYSIRGPIHAADDGIRVGDRLLATLGVSVRDWVTGFGAYVNLNPNLDAYRSLDCPATTSLQRERRGPVRASLVRERVIAHFQQQFGFKEVALFTDHPALNGLTQRCSQPRALEGV